MNLFDDSGATFSACGTYRYRLWRNWDASLPVMLFIMLNPSTADEVTNDPTVERCQRRCAALGFGGLVVANLFALRSTDPNALYSSSAPIGPDNDEAIRSAAAGAGKVVCAWGTHGNFQGRGKAVLQLLADAGVSPFCLGVNGDGTPKHPLYVSYGVALQPLTSSMRP